MKKFLLNILKYIIIPVFLFACLADYFLSSQLKKSNSFAAGEYPVWNSIYDSTAASDILIYGSSRALVHVDATLMENRLHARTYNLGVDGHNFFLQNLRHNIYLAHNPKPRLIIFSCDMLTLQKRPDLFNSEQFLPYMFLNKTLQKPLSTYEGFTNADYVVPLLRYYGKYKAVLEALRIALPGSKNNAVRIKGYEGKLLPWNTDFDRAKATMKSYTVKLNTATVALFNRFLQDCIHDSIKIVFVYTPEYIEGQQFISNRDSVMKIFQKSAREYAIPFFDFSADTISFQKKYFYNALHLNKTGSQLFTQKLIDSLLVSHTLAPIIQ